ncbi:MAG: sterol carrier protein domain-containing protein [Pseudomonadales bacterium]|nr:sterol carrier protein domain-containing protein [Pseudomonadales bacterium]
MSKNQGLWRRWLDHHHDKWRWSVAMISGDNVCPWNNGTYQLIVSTGSASDTLSNAPAEISDSINELALRLSGYSSVAWLEQIVRLKVRHTSRLGHSRSDVCNAASTSTSVRFLIFDFF